MTMAVLILVFPTTPGYDNGLENPAGYPLLAIVGGVLRCAGIPYPEAPVGPRGVLMGYPWINRLLSVNLEPGLPAIITPCYFDPNSAGELP